jgi:CheY-like chemotaxis protein
VLTKKIVVSESAELLALLETSFFHREGFHFFPVRSSDKFYQLVETEAPAMAILDLDILGHAGLDCCRCIKCDPLLGKTRLLVLLPEKGEKPLVEGLRRVGCDALVSRPLEPLQLLDAACGLLGVSQRLARRVPVDFQVVYTVAGGKQKVGRVVNLNADGMFVAAERLFPVGTALGFDLALPGLAGPLACQGRVAWVNHPEWCKKNILPSGMGIQFLASSSTFRETLSGFLEGLALNG